MNRRLSVADIFSFFFLYKAGKQTRVFKRSHPDFCSEHSDIFSWFFFFFCTWGWDRMAGVQQTGFPFTNSGGKGILIMRCGTAAPWFKFRLPFQQTLRQSDNLRHESVSSPARSEQIWQIKTSGTLVEWHARVHMQRAPAGPANGPAICRQQLRKLMQPHCYQCFAKLLFVKWASAFQGLKYQVRGVIKCFCLLFSRPSAVLTLEINQMLF